MSSQESQGPGWEGARGAAAEGHCTQFPKEWANLSTQPIHSHNCSSKTKIIYYLAIFPKMLIKNNDLKLRRLIAKILFQAWQITCTSEQKLEHMVWVKTTLAVFNTYSHLKMAPVVSSINILLSFMNLTLHISGNQLTPAITPAPLNSSRIASPFRLSKEIENIYCNHFCLIYEKVYFCLFTFLIWFRLKRHLLWSSPSSSQCQ